MYGWGAATSPPTQWLYMGDWMGQQNIWFTTSVPPR